jgi:predicted nucleic acid-binding protein
MPIFDTNIVIDYLRGEDDAKEIIRKHSKANDISITSMTCYELVKGLRGPKEEELLDVLFSRVKIYVLDLKAARFAGNLQKSLQSSGSQLSEGDVLIMGMVLANGETLVTRDRKGFGRLDSDSITIA